MSGKPITKQQVNFYMSYRKDHKQAIRGIKMSDELTTNKQSPKEVVDYIGVIPGVGKVYTFNPIDIKRLRAKLGLSEAEFADLFSTSVRNIRLWERGNPSPKGPALMLLNVIAKDHGCHFIRD